MYRIAFFFLLVCTANLFALTIAPPVSLTLTPEDPAGFDYPFKVSVQVAVRADLVEQSINTGNVKLKIFLPPAMELLRGNLEWQGTLAAGESKTMELLVKPTLSKPLVWDIGVVATSNLLARAIKRRISIYIESNRGAVLWDIHRQIEKNAWLKEGLGFREINVIEDGVVKTITAPFVDHLQSQKDLELMPIQQARPNKLYQ